MKIEEIDAMPAGIELDALIAEKVMGCDTLTKEAVRYFCACSNREHSKGDLSGDWNEEIKPFSTDIRAAWEVVETLNPKHPLILMFRPTEKDWWIMLPDKCKHPKGQLPHGPDCVTPAFADTAPLAICRAALKIRRKS